MMVSEQIRCFIAIELPFEAKRRLDLVIHTLKKELRSGFRWVPVNNIHLTLKFLGDVPARLLPQLKEVFISEISRHVETSLAIAELGVFPNLRQPRILWAGIQAQPVLFELQKQIDRQTEHLGFPGEARPYSPHLTLARSSNFITPSEIKTLMKTLTEIPPFQAIPMDVTGVTLFQSQLKPEGALYTPLANTSLKTKT